MNEQNVKALFMACYLGQKVLYITNDYKGNPVLNELMEVNTYQEKDPRIYLLLKPINKLTDNQLATFSNIAGIDKPSFERYLNYFLIRKDIEGRESGYTFKIWYSDCSFEVVINGKLGQATNVNNCYQYLLRIGILLPFTYLNENNQPVTLQPDEIIAKGWAKLV